MIAAAGAKTVSIDDIDAGVRFLVVGEAPELADANDDEAARKTALLGEMKQRAIELGVTIIPAWKLQAYLRTLDDSLTTPLGSSLDGKDFPPEANPSSSRRFPTQVSDLYMKNRENVQTTNEIVSP